jgi:hypothetical protein
MGASRVKTNRAIVAAVAVLAAGGGLLPGCKGSRREPTVISDPGPAQLAEARGLAAEAQREQAAGRTDRAIELYKQSLARSRELGFVQNNLGLLLMEKDNYLDAVALFDEAAYVMPESAKPLYNIGLAYWNRGWPEKALQFYGKALMRDPSDRDTLRAAVMAGKAKDLVDDEALARVRRALMLETDPRWKRMEQAEQFRIEFAMARAKESAPLGLPSEGPAGAMDRATPGPVVTSPPVAAPGPVVPARRPETAPAVPAAETPPAPAPAPIELPPAPAPAPTGPAVPRPASPVAPPGGATGATGSPRQAL